MDVSQAGANDRVVVDFEYLRSQIPLARIDVFLLDAQSTYYSQYFNVPLQDEPFLLELPFSSFRDRGGGIDRLDPAHVHSVYFSLSPAYFTGIDEIDLAANIGRIRFASAIPEPSIFISLVGASTGLVLVVRR